MAPDSRGPFRRARTRRQTAASRHPRTIMRLTALTLPDKTADCFRDYESGRQKPCLSVRAGRKQRAKSACQSGLDKDFAAPAINPETTSGPQPGLPRVLCGFGHIDRKKQTA